jgi:hypothetical protein
MNIMLLYQKLVNKQLEALIDSFISIVVDNTLKANRVLFRKILPIVFRPFKEVPHISTSVFE